MGIRISSIFLVTILFSCVLASRLVAEDSILFRERPRITSSLVGGWSEADATDPSVITAAKFAVYEHNKEQKLTGNHKLMYSKVVSAQKQVVQGVMYLITVEARMSNKPRHYEAKVWVKEWENFEKLMDFKLLD